MQAELEHQAPPVFIDLLVAIAFKGAAIGYHVLEFLNCHSQLILLRCKIIKNKSGGMCQFCGKSNQYHMVSSVKEMLSGRNLAYL